MRSRIPGPLCGYKLGTDWIDDGTMCLSRSSPPGPLGPGNEDGLFNLHFLVRDKRTGKPLTDAPYKLTLENGQEILGRTDPFGFTKTVSAGSAIIATLEVPYHGNGSSSPHTDRQQGSCRH